MSTDVSEEHIVSIFRVKDISRARYHHESWWEAEIHGIISQKIALFITTDVRTSNPTTFFQFLMLIISPLLHTAPCSYDTSHQAVQYHIFTLLSWGLYL
jgi:hypothetical protein